MLVVGEYETLMKAVELVKKEKIDFLLPVGGGSVIDGTKLIAAAIHFDGEPWDILAKHQPFHSALPIGCVLTLPATGPGIRPATRTPGRQLTARWTASPLSRTTTPP